MTAPDTSLKTGILNGERLSWLVHDEEASILSADIDSAGARLATGASNGSIRIWKADCLLSSFVIPKGADLATMAGSPLLATLSGHAGAVNTVRFSPDSTLLASAADDGAVYVWTVEQVLSSAGGSSKEKWKVVRRCQALLGDVFDVCWCPQSRRLVCSCLDGAARVFQVAQLPTGNATLLGTLLGHKGIAKGVSWDPLGQWVCSLASDGRLALWDILKLGDANPTPFYPLELLQQPFSLRSVDKSNVARLGWSPFGDHLAIPHVSLNGQPYIMVLWRETLINLSYRLKESDTLAPSDASSAYTLLGPLSKAAVAVRHCGEVFGRDDAQMSTPSVRGYVWFAALLANGTIQIFNAQQNVAYLVLENALRSDPTDLCWAPSGRCLLSVAVRAVCLRFKPTALGSPLNLEQKKQVFQETYERYSGMTLGASLIPFEPPQVRRAESRSSFADSPVPMVIDIDAGHERVPPVADRLAPSSKGAEPRADVPDVSSVQQISVTSKGKKRIAPVAVGGSSSEAPASSPVGVQSHPELRSAVPFAPATVSGAGRMQIDQQPMEHGMPPVQLEPAEKRPRFDVPSESARRTSAVGVERASLVFSDDNRQWTVACWADPAGQNCSLTCFHGARRLLPCTQDDIAWQSSFGGDPFALLCSTGGVAELERALAPGAATIQSSLRAEPEIPRWIAVVSRTGRIHAWSPQSGLRLSLPVVVPGGAVLSCDVLPLSASRQGIVVLSWSAHQCQLHLSLVDVSASTVVFSIDLTPILPATFSPASSPIRHIYMKQTEAGSVEKILVFCAATAVPAVVLSGQSSIFVWISATKAWHESQFSHPCFDCLLQPFSAPHLLGTGPQQKAYSMSPSTRALAADAAGFLYGGFQNFQNKSPSLERSGLLARIADFENVIMLLRLVCGSQQQAEGIGRVMQLFATFLDRHISSSRWLLGMWLNSLRSLLVGSSKCALPQWDPNNPFLGPSWRKSVLEAMIRRFRESTAIEVRDSVALIEEEFREWERNNSRSQE